MATGRLVRTLQPDVITGGINAVASVPGGQLASASDDGVGGQLPRLLVWEVATGRLVRMLGRHTDIVNAMASLPGGLLASASGDAVQVWEVETGRLVRTLEGHTDEVMSLASLQGGLLASGSMDETVVVWRSN